MKRASSFRPDVALRKGAIACAAAGIALAGVMSPAAGQDYTPLLWAAEGTPLASHAEAHDEGVDLVYWFEDADEDRHWIYATGFVTEMDGNTVVGTRFATFKYDAEFLDTQTGDPPLPAETAYFPPPGTPISPGDTFKAVAMAVDVGNDGDIYVTGQAPRPGGSDQDYVVVKYNSNLDQQWAYYYDGPVSGDDIPADIGVGGEGTGLNKVIVVTGTSPGSGTGKDIASVALHPDGAEADTLWPDVGWGDGVRRWNWDEVDGDDRAVELGGITIAEESSVPVLALVILGTSWGGSEDLDDYITMLWHGTQASPQWERRYDHGGNDVATALDASTTRIYATGYSEAAVASFGPTTPQIDYATVAYDFDLLFPIFWAERWDYTGADDYAFDIHAGVVDSHPTFGARWNI